MEEEFPDDEIDEPQVKVSQPPLEEVRQPGEFKEMDTDDDSAFFTRYSIQVYSADNVVNRETAEEKEDEHSLFQKAMAKRPPRPQGKPIEIAPEALRHTKSLNDSLTTMEGSTPVRKEREVLFVDDEGMEGQDDDPRDNDSTEVSACRVSSRNVPS